MLRTRWEDGEKMLGRCWEHAGKVFGKMVGKCVGRCWKDAGNMFGKMLGTC